ncbi:MarR family transcriptional regulator [Microbacterium sp. 2FI]|uniref:MarR family winged helix-turn-helix transcriptional regulator n=1 Tax=Microbacterium sp. 2FI TaxID=2502193 RepID=UPI002017C732|nr:MarR family transcriptional regulator [Microbacterium sp. 2FI]
MNDAKNAADEIVTAYLEFRRADADVQTRVRAATGLGDNEIRVMEYVISTVAAGQDATPSDISRRLGVSSASTTALLDRLERAGLVERANHPTDRRSILISATPEAERKLASTIGDYDARLRRVASALDPDDRVVVAAFLADLTDAAKSVAQP